MNKYEVVVRGGRFHMGTEENSTEVVVADKYNDEDGVLRFYRGDVLTHSFAPGWIAVTSDVDDDSTHHTVVAHKTNQLPALIEFEIEAKSSGKSGKRAEREDGAREVTVEIGVGKTWKILLLDGTELGSITT
jgi:hypothetical protein